MFVEYRIESTGFIYLFIYQVVYFNTLNQNIVALTKFLYPFFIHSFEVNMVTAVGFIAVEFSNGYWGVGKLGDARSGGHAGFY